MKAGLEKGHEGNGWQVGGVCGWNKVELRKEAHSRAEIKSI